MRDSRFHAAGRGLHPRKRNRGDRFTATSSRTNFRLRHDRDRQMANSGRHTVGRSFSSRRRERHLNGKHVVFGEVGGYGRGAWHREARQPEREDQGSCRGGLRRAVVLWAGPESQLLSGGVRAWRGTGRIQRDIENFEFLSDDRKRRLAASTACCGGAWRTAAPESKRCHVFFFFVHSFNIYTFSSLKLNANLHGDYHTVSLCSLIAYYYQT